MAMIQLKMHQPKKHGRRGSCFMEIQALDKDILFCRAREIMEDLGVDEDDAVELEKFYS